MVNETKWPKSINTSEVNKKTHGYGVGYGVLKAKEG